jgi:Flp pilus assembly protein protease CpaA
MEPPMTTGVVKLLVSFVLLLLFHALLLIDTETLLAQLVGRLALPALLVCGLGGFIAGVLGAADLDHFLQSLKNRAEEP